MGRPKKVKVPEETALVKQELAMAAAVDTGAVQLSEGNLEQYQRERYIKEVKELNDSMFEGLKKMCRMGNDKALRIAAEMLQLVKQGGGLTIQTNILNAGAVREDRAQQASFASIVRNTENARRLVGHEEFMEHKRKLAEQIIDVTPES